jgi:hypothetical protein
MKTPANPEKVQQALDTFAQEDGDCLMWAGRLSKSCGHPKYGGMVMRREVWQMKNGRELKPGELVTVTCGRPACLEHLALTNKAEIARKTNADPRVKAIKRLKSAAASRASAKKLDMDKAKAIRESTDDNHAEAEKWGVTHGMVSKIRLGHAWAESIKASPFAGLGGR